MDSCFGCFKQHFAKGQTFTYDLFELGEFYLEYCELMEHWDTALPGAVLHVQYEEVVADLETQVRRILDFCGLPFEEACVNFHGRARSENRQLRAGPPADLFGSYRHGRIRSHLDP